MDLSGYYTSGQFAKMAKISVRTVRFYDKQNILKPSYVSENGSRYYTDQDFVKLQQILLLKYLSFSLSDIRSMMVDGTDYQLLLNALELQQKLVQDRIEQLQMVEKAVEDTAAEIREKHSADWSRMLSLIHLTNMEQSLRHQYQDSANISARIHLHSLYSQNPQSWFSWLFEQYGLKENMCVLEIGCGDGTFWAENLSHLPQGTAITLSDISDGMLRDAKRRIGSEDSRFSFQVFDCHEIPFPDSSFDLVIANHVLFYPQNLPLVFQEIQRVLKPGGQFRCSAYSSAHMQEISRLVQEFDDRIILSADRLYEKFGKENGKELLSPYFSKILWHSYEDCLIIRSPEALIHYILSCHGNQNRYIVDKYKEFFSFTSEKVKKGFYITKDAGYFSCENIKNN